MKKEKGLKIISLLTAATVVFSNSSYLHHLTKEKEEELDLLANSAVCIGMMAAWQEDGCIVLKEKMMTDSKDDYRAFEARSFVKYLQELNIKYCDALGQYFTEDGRNIAVIRIDYEALSDGTALKNRAYRMVEVQDDYQQEFEELKLWIRLNEGESLNIIKQNVMIIKTKAFSMLEKMDFIYDVPDKPSFNDDGYQEAELVLRKKNQR